MELRKEPRFARDEPVTVTVLRPSPVEFRGHITDRSEKGLRLLLDRPLMPGTTFKLEFAEALVLGEVVWCRPSASGYMIGMKVEHLLAHTSELARLAHSLVGDSPAAPARAGLTEAVER